LLAITDKLQTALLTHFMIYAPWHRSLAPEQLADEDVTLEKLPGV
jgi:hypothetical protein